jgi:hypothetical protein
MCRFQPHNHQAMHPCKANMLYTPQSHPYGWPGNPGSAPYLCPEPVCRCGCGWSRWWRPWREQLPQLPAGCWRGLPGLPQWVCELQGHVEAGAGSSPCTHGGLALWWHWGRILNKLGAGTAGGSNRMHFSLLGLACSCHDTRTVTWLLYGRMRVM